MLRFVIVALQAPFSRSRVMRPTFIPLLGFLLFAWSAAGWSQPREIRSLDAQTRGVPRISCAQTARDMYAGNAQRMELLCPSDCERQPVWGTGYFTDDSSICGAAIHAGIIHKDSGGLIDLYFRPGLDAYKGSVENGVRAKDWGAWPRSFVLARPGETPEVDHEPEPEGPELMMMRQVQFDAPVAEENAARSSESRGRGSATPRRRVRLAEDAPSPQERSQLRGTIIPSGDREQDTRRRRNRRASNTPPPALKPADASRPRTNQVTGYTAPDAFAQAPSAFGRLHCETRGIEIRGPENTSLVVICPAGCGSAALWGSDVYGDDSSICSAAIHQGLITPATGGPVEVRIGGATNHLEGSERNGVTSATWRSWPRTFTLHQP